MTHQPDCSYVKVGGHADVVHRSQCKPCNAESWANHVTPTIMLGTVPGGHNDTHGSAQYKYQSNFDKGLDAYKSARDEGLRPKGTTVAAVDAAHREVKSQKRALKKLGMDASELKTVAGVE